MYPYAPMVLTCTRMLFFFLVQATNKHRLLIHSTVLGLDGLPHLGAGPSGLSTDGGTASREREDGVSLSGNGEHGVREELLCEGPGREGERRSSA